MQYRDILAQIQTISYSEAIDRYNYLKTRFFMDYSTAADKEEKELIKEFEQNIIEDINNNPIEGQETLTQELYKDLENTIISKIENVKKEQIDLRAQYDRRKKQGNEEAKKLIKYLMPEEELKQEIENKLIAMGVKGFTATDILNQVRGYRNGIKFNKKNTEYYVRSTKGYFREAMVFKAFSKLRDNLEKLPVISAGAANNPYDIYIDFFNNIETSMNLAVTENIDIGYGMQVKSWIAPWEKEEFNFWGEKYGYSIGSRENLLSESGLKNKSGIYNFLKGILFLEKKAIQAIGPQQVGWITGNGFYWTVDLIKNFRAMNYFLAFGYQDKKPLSTNVVWQGLFF